MTSLSSTKEQGNLRKGKAVVGTEINLQIRILLVVNPSEIKFKK